MSRYDVAKSIMLRYDVAKSIGILPIVIVLYKSISKLVLARLLRRSLIDKIYIKDQVSQVDTVLIICNTISKEILLNTLYLQLS